MFLSFLSSWEASISVLFIIWLVVNCMEFVITWCHLLYQVISDGVTSRDLGIVHGVGVLDDRLFPWSIITDDGCTGFASKDDLKSLGSG